MTVKRIYTSKKSGAYDTKFMKLIKSERQKAPTVKGQLQTTRTYKLIGSPTEILIIGDEIKSQKKGIAVYVGYMHIGYFDTLDDAKQALYKRYG
jgi:hypothetical protein